MSLEVFKSKRFWIAIAGVVWVAFENVLPFSQEQLTAIVILIASWIVGDSLRATVPKSPE